MLYSIFLKWSFFFQFAWCLYVYIFWTLIEVLLEVEVGSIYIFSFELISKIVKNSGERVYIYSR